MSLEETFKKIKNKCKELKQKYRVNSLVTLPIQERECLAQLWEQYVAVLPPEYKRHAIAILGYPGIIRLEELPNKIREDPRLASLIVKLYGR